MTTAPNVAEPSAPARRRHRLGVRPHATLSGALFAGAGTPLLVAAAVHGSFPAAPVAARLGAALGALAWLAAAYVVPRWPRAGRRLTSLGVLSLLAIAAPRLLANPSAALAALLATAAALAWLGGVGGFLFGPYLRRESIHAGQARGAALAASGTWLVTTLSRMHDSPFEVAVVAFALAVAAVLIWEWTVLVRRTHPVRALGLRWATALSAAGVAAAWGHPWTMVSAGAFLAVFGVGAIRRPPRFAPDQTDWWEPWLGHPERLFVGTFALVSLLGTLLLAIPLAAASGRSIGLPDALFTSISAVCVTGLIVRDTPVDFTPFGQVVLLLLIQIGGLGIMTFSTAAMRALGRRMSLRHEGAVASLISTRDRGQLAATARKILIMTFTAEAVGAVLLYFPFRQAGDGLGPAVWRAVFTSVSAFCNAGFALQSDSLLPYRLVPLVLHVVALLVVLGGLSPAAVLALPSLLGRRRGPVSAQAKLSLAATGVLLIIGTAFFLSLEWTNTLAGLPFADRLHNAYFQSVTLRTAGFNSVDISGVRPATLTLMMIWMLIGGCPGGTAGGIKTTTAVILFLAVVQAMRGQPHLVMFRRRVSDRSRARATVVVTLALTTLVAAVMALQLTQAIPSREILFEVASALGTVGLTIGATPSLDGVGKLVITLCMFVGRVGGVTLLMFLSQRSSRATIDRPEEEIDVG